MLFKSLVPDNMETPLQLLWGLGLVVPTLALMLWLRLDAVVYIVAVGRGLLQLFVFGYLVALVVELRQPGITLGAVVLLLLLAAALLRSRWVNHPSGFGNIAFLALPLGVGLAVGYGVLLVVQPNPWYEAQVWLPLVGVVSGNALAGAAIAGERLLSNLRYSPGEIEARLCLGASRQQAMAPYRQSAVAAGLLPTLNSLTLVGLVTMSPLMAGGILGKMDPLQAAAYELLLLLLSGFGTLVTIAIVVMLIEQKCFGRGDRLVQW
jgi:putative ABC transport system permease protein